MSGGPHHFMNADGYCHAGDMFEAGTAWIALYTAEVLAEAWDRGRAAERRDWEFTADLSTPDEERQPWPNPYRKVDR